MQAVINERAAQLRELAQLIATKSNAAAEIAQGFALIADCMEPCFDCGHPEDDPAGRAYLVELEAEAANTVTENNAPGLHLVQSQSTEIA